MEHTYRELDVPDVGLVRTWTELVDVQEPLVSFRHVFRFARDDSEVVSDSTLRFRDHDEIAASLSKVGSGCAPFGMLQIGPDWSLSSSPSARRHRPADRLPPIAGRWRPLASATGPRCAGRHECRATR
jgi:hypothetical protein